MERLCNLTQDRVTAWRRERMRVGQERYGDSDLKRYGMVDIVEELMDAANILDRFLNRARVQGYEFNGWQKGRIEKVKDDISDAFRSVVSLDKELPDDLCTDENGGERIWWK